MELDWETFKSALGPFSVHSSIVYVDDEGSEVSVDCECELKEALRLARLNKNYLKLIIYHKSKSNETNRADQCQPVQSTVNHSEKCLDFKRKSMSPVAHNSSCKENTCHSHGDVTPEWFTLYMKKFKKELLYELKSYIHDTVHSAVEKEKKLSITKSEAGESHCEKNEISFSSVGTQSKKETKSLERRLYFLLDEMVSIYQQRQKHSHVPWPEYECLTKIMMLKQKILKIEQEHKVAREMEKYTFEKKNRHKKTSASFLRSSIPVTLTSASKFKVLVHIENDGYLHWSASARLECFEFNGLYPKESRISLPKLYPKEAFSTVLTGTVSEFPGFHYFKCKVVDSNEQLGQELTCWTKIESPERPQKISSDSVTHKDVTTQLIDFENEVISSTQKKIEENISEIERRLHDIDLLQPTTYVETNPGEAKQRNKKSDELQTGCDFMQDLESKDRPAKMEVLFENNDLGTVTPSGMCSLKIGNEKGEKENPTNLNKIKKDEESSSDSELSIIFISEEEDNFLVVPSESFSHAANGDKNYHDAESGDKPPASTGRAESTLARQEIRNEIQVQTEQDEVTPNENFRQSQQSPTRSRCSPFGEEISKPKKMKSKSTEYCFTAANLIQPVFTQVPGFFEGRPSRFTFTGEKEKATSTCDAQNIAAIPETDALGRHIYAVNSNGHCLPVRDMLKSEESRRSPEAGVPQNVDRDHGIQGPPERRNERPNEIPTVNILPNVINGASNVASLAFNTAKSVISNLQSAFVTEGKTEFGQPAYEDKVKPLTGALFKLYEMGFTDFQTNRQLLILHNNDLFNVVNELVRQYEYENPSEESQ